MCVCSVTEVVCLHCSLCCHAARQFIVLNWWWWCGVLRKCFEASLLHVQFYIWFMGGCGCVQHCVALVVCVVMMMYGCVDGPGSLCMYKFVYTCIITLIAMMYDLLWGVTFTYHVCMCALRLAGAILYSIIDYICQMVVVCHKVPTTTPCLWSSAFGLLMAIEVLRAGGFGDAMHSHNTWQAAHWL